MTLTSTLVMLNLLHALIIPPVFQVLQPQIGIIKLGTKAKGLKILPPWTLRKCLIDKGEEPEIRAVYTRQGSIHLRLFDEDCYISQNVVVEQKYIIEDLTLANKKLAVAYEKGQEIIKHKEARNKKLNKQLLEEIKEKNKYKYKPNYNWLWWTAAGTVALAGVVFGAAVWVTKAE